MLFAKWVFRLAGAIGLLLIVPLYFQESQYGADHPPAVNHPEFFYGFLGVTLAWQLLFLLIGSDPSRYRAAMLPAMVEKASFVVAIPILYAQQRAPAVMVGAALLDGLWLLLFVAAFFATRHGAGGRT